MRKAGLFKGQQSDFAVQTRQLRSEKDLTQASEMADYSGVKNSIFVWNKSVNCWAEKDLQQARESWREDRIGFGWGGHQKLTI